MAAPTFFGTCRLIRQDLRAHRLFYERNPLWRHGVSTFVHPGWISVLLYRVGRYLHYKPGLRLAARFVYLINLFLSKSEMTPVSDLGGGFVLVHPSGNIIASAVAGRDCVQVGGGLGGAGSKKDIGAGPGQPVLGDRVFLAHRGFSLGAYRINDDATVGPMCFVHRDIEAGEFLPAQLDVLTERKILKGRRDVLVDDPVFYARTAVNMRGGQDGR